MLKVACPQEELHRTVQVVSRGVSGRSTQPVQNNIYLQAQGNELRLVATDLEYLGLDANLPALVTEEGQITVPGRIFNEIVGKLPPGEVTLECNEKGEVLVRCGGARYQVRAVSADDFQMLPEVVPGVEFSLPEGDLHSVVAQTVFACSPDETRPILTGALFNVEPEELTVVATDTYRLALRRLHLSTGVPEPRKAIVSHRLLHELLRILDESSAEPVQVKLSERLIEFAFRNLKLGSRLIDGEFPNYEKVVPESHDKQLLVGVHELDRALQRALIVAREDNNRVVLHGEGDQLRITASSPEVGQVEEEVPMEMQGEPVDIAFNVRYMMEMLEAAGSEQVVIGLSGSLNPGTLRPAGREDYIYVLMPMQIMT